MKWYANADSMVRVTSEREHKRGRRGASLRLGVKLPSRERPYTWTADWLVNCTGTDPQLFGNRQPLMDTLRAEGSPGPALNVGVATDDRGRVLNDRGRPLGWLWAIGSLRQGQLWESTAIPECGKRARRPSTSCASWAMRP